MRLLVICLQTGTGRFFFIIKEKMLEYMIFQSYTPTFIIEPFLVDYKFHIYYYINTNILPGYLWSFDRKIPFLF